MKMINKIQMDILMKHLFLFYNALINQVIMIFFTIMHICMIIVTLFDDKIHMAKKYKI